MNSDYCGSCGEKIEYLLKKPNFCPHCGSALSKGSTSAIAPEVTASPAMHDDNDPEGTDVVNVPQVHKLQYEVEGDFAGIGRSQGTLGDMLNLNKAEAPPPSKKSQSSPKATAKKTPSSKRSLPMNDAIKRSIEECRSSSGNPIDVG